MATRLQRLCDFHLLKKHEEVEGEERIVPINAKKVRIDSCADCYTENFGNPIAGMLTLLEELGARTVDDNTSRPPIGTPKQKIACPEKGCDYSAVSRTSFRTHMPDAHDVSLPIWEGQHGKSVEGEEIKFFCTFCQGGFTTPQGRGAHMSAEHDYVPGQDSSQPQLTDGEPQPERRKPGRPAKKTTAKKTTAKKAT